MSTNNEGSGEIEANDRRVATAKKAVALTARYVEAARKALEVAQKEHSDAQEELTEAETAQVAAQKKWEVVDLAEDDDNDEDKAGDTINLVDNNAKKTESSGSTKRAATSAEDTSKKARRVSAEPRDEAGPEEVVLEGCGVHEVNGTYKKDESLPHWYYGNRKYVMKGQWKGKDANFVISRHGYPKYWEISVSYTGRYSRKKYKIFFQHDDGDCNAPPADGWEIKNGSGPPPKITVKS